MDEIICNTDPISIEDAINLTAGTRKYQKTMLIILIMSCLAISPLILSIPYFLPIISAACLESKCYESDDHLQNSATVEFNEVNESALLRLIFINCYDFGKIVGCLIPWLADRYGRKRMITYSCMGGTIFCVVMALSRNAIMLWVSGFLLGACEMGILLVGFILCAETIDSQKRSLYLGAFSLLMSVFAIFLVVLHYLNIDWRWLILISAALLLVQSYLMTYVLESPRFLLTNLANVHATTKVLNKISLLNGKGIFQRQLVSANTRNLSLLSVQDICRYNTITLQLVGCSAAWFNVILGYYSIVFLMPNLTDYVYLQSIGIYCCELSAIVVVMYVINDIGRKKTTVYFFVTVGLIFFLIALLHYAIDDETTQVLVDGILFLIARTALYGGFYLIYIYTAEMFPTQIRGTAFGICNMAGRIASIAGTNFATLNSLIRSTIILGGIMILTAAVTMLLEETLGNELEEVIESNQQILLNSAEDNRLGRE